jgi:cytoskeletal protein RodZ
MGRSAEPVLKSTTEELHLPNLLADEPRELSFGQYLRRQRILRGISRNEVLRVTKVSLEYVEALENDQFDKLPPRAFVVGFLRVLCRYAGLDVDEVVNRFLAESAQRKGLEETRTAEVGYVRRNMRALLAICGLACFLFLMFLPYFRHRS